MQFFLRVIKYLFKTRPSDNYLFHELTEDLCPAKLYCDIVYSFSIEVIFSQQRMNVLFLIILGYIVIIS